MLELGGQGSTQSSTRCGAFDGAFDELADTKENLTVLSEFHGNYSLGNLRGMGAGKEIPLG